MIKKIKNFLIDIFSFTSISFTLYLILEVIIHKINEDNYLSINSLIFVFSIFVVVSVINYLIWNTNLIGRYKFIKKSLFQYLIGLVIIYLCNELTLYKIIFIFIYYNILYFAMKYIFMIKQNKDIERLNKIIMKLKEDKDEQS